MAYERAIAGYRKLYAKLLRFYPQSYRERFGEGMEQTFNDLCREQVQAERGLFSFALWMFFETSAGVFRENVRFTTMPLTKIIRVLLVATGLLIVPLTASFFVDGWNWGVGGYVFAWVMFASAGLNASAYSVASLSAPDSWAPLDNAPPQEGGGGWMVHADADHNLLYSSSFRGGFWRYSVP